LFVEDDAVVAEGVGEVMYPAQSLREYHVLLVNPGFSVSTRWVFENLGLTRTLKESKLASFEKMRPLYRHWVRSRTIWNALPLLNIRN